MLTPEYLASCMNTLLGMYDELNTAIVEDIARRIVKTGVVTESAKWQAKQLQEAGGTLDWTIKQVSGVTGWSDTEIERLFREAGVKSINNDAQPLIRAGLNVTKNLSESMADRLFAEILKTQGNVNNLTMTTGVTAKNLYLEATTMAHMKVSSGAFSYQEAIRQAVKYAATDGSMVLYANGGSTMLDVAVRRSVLTGVNQTAAVLTEIYAGDIGAEYYETTAHAGARPTHEEWQGQVFKIEGDTSEYPNFEEVTGYGTAGGLCGVNCRHSFHPFFPGISESAYSKELLSQYNERRYEYDGEELTDYECSQVQRGMERKIREHKRTLASYNAAMLEEPSLEESMRAAFQAESVKLKRKEKQLKEFCGQTGRKVDTFRTQVIAHKDSSGRIVGFNRSVSQKAVWANRKART